MTLGSRKLIWIAGALVLLTLAYSVPPAYAQVSGATLSGVILDESQTAVANARISIKNTATGVVRELKTMTDGSYAAANLLPGTYQITLTADGFVTEVRDDITLAVGAVQTLNLTLRKGQVSETYIVKEAPPAVDLS